MASSRAYPSLERVPGKQNWVDHAGGLPDYIERIAKHIHYDSGYSISHAIASAVNRVKKLILKGSPAVKAKAAKALAQWEAKKNRGKVKLTDEQLIEEVVINMAEDPKSKEGSKSSGVTDKTKLAAAIKLYRSKKSSYSPEQRAKIEARLKSSQQRLGVKVGLSEDDIDLTQKVFFKNRRTPEIVSDGAKPKKGGAGTKAGEVVARKKVTEDDKKKMKGGKWLREDKSGKKPGDSGYLSGPSKGPDANKKRKKSTKNLSEQVELFKRNQHRLDLTQRENAVKYLEAQAKEAGVTINLAQPVGVTIARQTGFNPSKHNRGFGGRFAPKAQ